MPVTYIAFVDDASRTLLFVGDRDEIGWFSNWLSAMSGQATGLEIDLDIAQGFEPRAGFMVRLSLAVGPDSVVFLKDDKTLVWEMSPSNCHKAAKLVQALAENSTPAHQYLEDAGDFVIEVSMEEWASPAWKDELRRLVGRS